MNNKNLFKSLVITSLLCGAGSAAATQQCENQTVVTYDYIGCKYNGYSSTAGWATEFENYYGLSEFASVPNSNYYNGIGTLYLVQGSCAVYQNTNVVQVCNSSPVASYRVTQQPSHPAGLNFVRISSTSTDPDGDSLSYQWEIDGQPAGTSSGVNIQTIEGRTISIKLTVTDNGPYSLSTTTTGSAYLYPWKNSGSNY